MGVCYPLTPKSVIFAQFYNFDLTFNLLLEDPTGCSIRLRKEAKVLSFLVEFEGKQGDNEENC